MELRDEKSSLVNKTSHVENADNVISRNEFVAKYGYKGIYLKPKQVEKLKVVYPNHFKAYEKEKRYE